MKPSELSPAARRLLELGSQVAPPTAEQTARMDHALEPLFRASRVTSPPASGSPARERDPRSTPSVESRLLAARGARPSRSMQQLFGLGGGKLVVALGALAATAGASFWLGRISRPGESSPPAASAPAPASTRIATLTLPAAVEASPPASAGPPAPTANAPITEPAQRATSAPPAAGVAAPEARSHAAFAEESARAAPSRREQRPPPRGLAAEIEQLARVEAALRQGRAERALSHLEQPVIVHLSEQAAALRAIAECELGAARGARGARSVLERWPLSAFQARIRAACRL